MKTVEDAIKELEARRSELIEEVRRIDNAVRDLHISKLEVKVGDIVQYRRDKKEYRVVEIDAPQYGWVLANPKNASGSWGKAKRRLFDDYTILPPS